MAPQEGALRPGLLFLTFGKVVWPGLLPAGALHIKTCNTYFLVAFLKIGNGGNKTVSIAQMRHCHVGK
jgi:hypothetical protein